MRRVPTSLLLPLALAACAEFDTPAELAVPTIIAVIAEPPVVRPGTTSRVSVVVAGPDGRLADVTPRWALVEAFPTVAPMGTVEVDGAEALYTAPATVPPRPEGVPPVDSLQLEVDVATNDGPRTLTAVKAMGVVDLDAANPTVRVVDADGAEVAALAGPRAGIPLRVAPEPAPGEDARYAWYATVGEIADYQSNPAELTAEAAGAGVVFVVYRDGVGGVAWRELPVTVE